ncbi:hypothetical protein DOTSEDRAFT_177341 [Dothistroma septosporum NZE10]|uniref:Enoyl reductase (ER) domain-containing protein n=1 Tax=Dothistroma septosporum (strain NZE10 / CBS 128990) TaxID=675120 RepID=N1PKT0_DOTSN|nr:hypothetical protein DOTSEDRAFT_177341 [Dothistroma septosporum NZE10]
MIKRLIRRLKNCYTTPHDEDHDEQPTQSIVPRPAVSHKPAKDLTVVSTTITASVGINRRELPKSVGNALLVGPEGEYHLEPNWPFPRILHDNEVLIRVQAVGLNPIDWKSVEYGFCLPQRPWAQASGVVEEVGSAVSDVHVGQKVWTSTYYKDIRAGCFQERIVVPAHTVLPVPSGVSMEEAATLGVSGVTAAMVLWKWLGMGMPGTVLDNDHKTTSTSDPAKPEPQRYLLIWGGGTVTGQYATQLAALSDIKTITVCSAATESLSYSLGATHVVCRNGKTTQQIVDEIRAIAGDAIRSALDLIGKSTSTACLNAVSSIAPVRFVPLATCPDATAIPGNIEMLNVEMKQFVLDPSNKVFADELVRLVASRQVRCPDVKVLDGGLGMVPTGLKMVKEGLLKGRKVVVRL